MGRVVSENSPLIYALGNGGAELLRDRFDFPQLQYNTRADWTSKNREALPTFSKHALELADFMVGMEVGARSIDGVEFISFREILATAPEETRRKKIPDLWSVRVTHDGEQIDIPVRPDNIYGLRFLNKGSESFFFVEADRATMPVTRANLRQSSYTRKFIAYFNSWQQWKQDPELSPFGFRNARVLSLTTSRKRIQTFIQESRKVTDHQGVCGFLFTEYGDFKTPEEIFKKPWVNARDEKVLLCD